MRRKHLVCIFVAVAAAAIALGAVNASAGGLLDNTTGTVKDTTGTVKDTTGTVTGTVKDTTGTVKDTTGTVKDTAGSVAGTAGSAVGSATGSGSSTTGTTGTSGSGTGTTGTTGTGTTGTGTSGGGRSSTGGEAGPGGSSGRGGRGRRGANGNGGIPAHPMAMPSAPAERPNGVPTRFNPTLSIAGPSTSPLGLPSFLVGQFEIPPFLLPMYQACGTQYGIPWQVLAGINKIETGFGTNLNVSSAGAVGWMQFMPSTWQAYGTDANGDGRADPFNPLDAICSAARYLQANGGDTNIRQAIFAYNHASWYVDEVLLAAQQYGKLPDSLVGSLTGLTVGDRFPIAAKSRYAEPTPSPLPAPSGAATGPAPSKPVNDYGFGAVHLNPGVNMTVGQEPQIRQALSALSAEIGKPVYVISGYRTPAHSVAVGGFPDDPHTKGIAADIGVGAPTRDSVASVSDAQLRNVGLYRPFSAPSEINHVQLLNGAPTSLSPLAIDIFSRDGAPVVAVSDGTIKLMGHTKKLGSYIVLQDDYGNKFIYTQLGSIRNHATSKSKSDASSKSKPDSKASKAHPDSSKSTAKKSEVQSTQTDRRRLYALPARRHNLATATLSGQLQPSLLMAANGARPHGGSHPHRATGALHRGSRVSAGTLLGRVGKTDDRAPHINFAIQPTGIGKGSVDPKPILDGWQLVHDTAIYGTGENPLRHPTRTSSAVSDLLMPRSTLAQQALDDPRLEIYRCGRFDIRRDKIDRRVLATMNFLADNGFRLKITSLKCGTTGKQSDEATSEHSAGDAMTISRIDGVPVAGHQGPGSTADSLIKTVLKQQGVMEPDTVTSHENLPGPVSTSASGNEGDAIDIGFTPLTGSGYQNPFPHAVKGRIDQGVDYVGKGPINAIGDARILQVGAPGWPNGGAGPAGQGVLYRLLDGPQAGKNIFVYEGVTPTVKTGQEVVAGQQIAEFYPGSSIEIGFADSDGVPLAHDQYVEGKVTGWGRKMNALLENLGAPGKLDHQFAQMLNPQEWSQVMGQLNKISNPEIPTNRSRSGEPSVPEQRGPSGPNGHGP